MKKEVDVVLAIGRKVCLAAALLVADARSRRSTSICCIETPAATGRWRS
jgi:hypothetical protein